MKALMKIRFLLTAAPVLFCSSVAAAQYTYIVPVAGFVTGFHSFYDARVTALNPNATAATVRYEAIYPSAGAGPCASPPPKIVPSRATAGFSEPCIFMLHAIVLTADQPLSVMVDVDAHLTGEPLSTQRVDVATDWIAAESEAMIPNLRMFSSDDKSKLVLVNPNDFPLTVSVRVERPELGKLVDATIQVPPRSFLMEVVAQIPTPEGGTIPRIYDAIHNITLRANGKFQAGASNTFQGASLYRAAVPLQP